MDVILHQQQLRLTNHAYSERSKHRSGKFLQPQEIGVGDLVYLYCDKNKSQARNRYLVVSIDNEWCLVKKFSGNQLRSTSYKVKLAECYHVPSEISSSSYPNQFEENDSDSVAQE